MNTPDDAPPFAPPPAASPSPGYGPPAAGYYPSNGAPYGAPQNEPPFRPSDDDNHLSALAICHFIYGGLVALGALIPGMYIVLGGIMAFGGLATTPAKGASPPPVAIGGILALIGGLLMVFMVAIAAVVVWSGLSIRRRQRHTLSFVVACFACLSVPLGTALGIFTLIVLNRPSVKALYARRA